MVTMVTSFWAAGATGIDRQEWLVSDEVAMATELCYNGTTNLLSFVLTLPTKQHPLLYTCQVVL